jgi:hypothetical protein
MTDTAEQNRARALAALREALPSRALRIDERARKPFESDGLNALREPWIRSGRSSQSVIASAFRSYRAERARACQAVQDPARMDFCLACHD